MSGNVVAPGMARFFLEKIHDEPVDFEDLVDGLRGHSPPGLGSMAIPGS